MLDRSKVMRELREISDKLFLDITPAFERAQTIWNIIISDPLFLSKVCAAQDKAPWLLPTWIGKLDDAYPLEAYQQPYRVLSVDGSQIYPDRHQGTSCFLINVGTVLLSYGMQGKAVTFDSMPSVYAAMESDSIESSTELVNCRRQELEFLQGLHMSKEHSVEDVPFVFFIDGSLIFWHLESKDVQLKDHYLSKYLLLLHQLYQSKTLIAGYISMPKNKEQLAHRLNVVENSFAKQVFKVNPVITFIAIVRINDVFPDIFEPVSKIDLSFTLKLFFTQFSING